MLNQKALYRIFKRFFLAFTTKLINLQELISFMKYSILLFLCLTFFSCEEDTIAPELYGTLSGKVIDDATGLPIVTASITTTPVSTTLETDAAGKFEIKEILVGNATIRAEKTGYRSNLETVSINEGQSTDVIIRLKRDSLDNRVPSTPVNVSPTKAAIDQSINLTIKWRKSTDINPNDIIRYTLLLIDANGNGVADTLITNTTDTSFTIQNLKFNNEYFWQVLVYDQSNQVVYGPVWNFKTLAAPDNRVLFARKTDGKYDIWSCSNTGATPMQLTFGGSNNWRPRYRPDRKKIAYLSNQSIDAQLFVMDKDGSNASQITTIEVAGYNTFDLDFCWSPTGAEILYMHNTRLYRIKPDGTGLTLFATAPAGYTFTEVDWNGATNMIAARITGTFIYDTRILQYNVNGTMPSVIVPEAFGMLQGGMYYPDGTRFVYTNDDIGFDSPDGRQLDARLKVKNLITGDIADFSLYKLPGTNDLDARFSPDGAKVIFVNTNNDGVSPRSIWIGDGSLLSASRFKIADNAEMPDWR
jgi:TolB protein